jgi:hypothetical protein
VKACLHCGSTVRYLPSAVLIDYCNCCRGSHRSAITLRTPFAITPASRHTFSTQPRLGLPWRLPPTYPSPGPRHFSIFKCDNIDQPFIQISSILPFPFLFYLGPQACVLKQYFNSHVVESAPSSVTYSSVGQHELYPL